MVTTYKQADTMPYAFVWHGYKWINTGHARFGGYSFTTIMEGELATIYARRDADGFLTIFTGMENWAPAYRSQIMCNLDNVVIYYPGIEYSPLDAYRAMDMVAG